MTRIAIATIALSASLIGAAAVCVRAGEADAGEGATPAGFALVELFTSEGCSSCPPADEVASDVARRAASLGTPVYVVAFHVDYWDRLGWKDRFGSPAFTARQRAYTERFGRDRLYTPQLVVNGAVEFVGSDRERARREINAALAPADEPGEPVGLKATLDPRVRANLRYALACRITGLDDSARRRAVLCTAVVEDGLTSDVTRGENAGKVLRHDGVVRWFAAHPIADEAPTSVSVHVPGDAARERTSIVAWVQGDEVGRVLAAARVRLTSASDERRRE